QEEMAKTMRLSNFISTVVLALVIGTYILTPFHASAYSAGQAVIRQHDSPTQADIKASLNSDRFKDVYVSVKNGVVVISGTVELCAYKEEAEKRAQRNKNAAAVRNEIQIEGLRISDAEL